MLVGGKLNCIFYDQRSDGPEKNAYLSTRDLVLALVLRIGEKYREFSVLSSDPKTVTVHSYQVVFLGSEESTEILCTF